jgi:hypothetical protein
MMARGIALSLLLVWAAAAAAAVDVVGALPPSGAVTGWQAEGKPETYTRDNLWDFIDGGAEYYLAYDFRKVVAQRYTRGGEAITLELYDMGSAPEAFGVWASDPPPEQPAVGQQSAYAQGLLQFWKGPVYGRVFAERETPDLKRAVIALGKAASTRIAEVGRLPDLLQALPAKGRVWRSERYLHQESSLNNVLYLGGGNPLGLGAKTEAAFARYGAKGNTRLLIVRYPAPAAAETAANRLATEAGPKQILAKRRPAMTATTKDGKGRGYLLLVTDAGAAGEAGRLAREAEARVKRLR